MLVVLVVECPNLVVDVDLLVLVVVARLVLVVLELDWVPELVLAVVSAWRRTADSIVTAALDMME